MHYHIDKFTHTHHTIHTFVHQIKASASLCFCGFGCCKREHFLRLAVSCSGCTHPVSSGGPRRVRVHLHVCSRVLPKQSAGTLSTGNVDMGTEGVLLSEKHHIFSTNVRRPQTPSCTDQFAPRERLPPPYLSVADLRLHLVVQVQDVCAALVPKRNTHAHAHRLLNAQ